MRSTGIRLAGWFSLVLSLLLAGCYQDAGQSVQQGTELPSRVATFTPQPAGLPVTALAVVNVDPAPTLVPAANQETVRQEIDPLNLTATAIIARATQTQAALLVAGQATVQAPVVTLVTPTVTPAGIVVATAVGSTDCIHVVQAGDRGLSSIATLYGVTVANIQQASGLLNVEIIHVGNELVIPGCGTTGYRQPETPGESCEPAQWRFVHTVLAGENLFRIALQYGLNVDELALFNCIPDPALIHVGQQIYIP